MEGGCERKVSKPYLSGRRTIRRISLKHIGKRLVIQEVIHEKESVPFVWKASFIRAPCAQRDRLTPACNFWMLSYPLSRWFTCVQPSIRKSVAIPPESVGSRMTPPVESVWGRVTRCSTGKQRARKSFPALLRPRFTPFPLRHPMS